MKIKAISRKIDHLSTEQKEALNRYIDYLLYYKNKKSRLTPIDQDGMPDTVKAFLHEHADAKAYRIW